MDYREQTEEQRAVRAAVARARYEASCAAEQVGYQCPPGSPERRACFDVAREIIQGGKQ